jgi:YfiH family protein
MRESFYWTNEPWGRALRARALMGVADHFYTTRDVDLEPLDSQSQAGWETVAASIGCARDSLIRVRQVHGATVFHADRARGTPPEHVEADALVTADVRQVLSVRVADCLPVLFADPAAALVAAAHAGWRGVAAGVLPAAVRVLAERGADPAALIVAIGPSIGPCCYRVGDELIHAFERAAADRHRWFSRKDDGLFLDLWMASRDQLVAEGVQRENVHVAAMCTSCNAELFHSFRREGSRAGRLAAVIRPRRRVPPRP